MADETLFKGSAVVAEETPLASVAELEAPPLESVKSSALKEEEEEVEVEVEAKAEEVVVVETEKPKPTKAHSEKFHHHLLPPPQSMVSFKEESNKVADLRDSEKKALFDLNQLVQKALDNHEFNPPPPPEAESSTPPPPPAAESSNPPPPAPAPAPAPTEIVTPTHESSEVEEKVAEAFETVNIDPNQQNPPCEEETQREAEKEVAAEEEEVWIWGIPLLKDERSDSILLKFLRARDFKVKETFAMLKNTIRWRKENSIDALVNENEFEDDDDLDKVVFMHGFDREGHPVCYNVYGEFQNKDLYHKMFSDEDKRIKFLRQRIQFLERSIRKLDFNPGGVSTIFQVNDLKNAPGPAKRELRLATKQALQLLQDNYPEFVAKQVFINVPWWYLAFYTMISPFLTQRTKSKFVFTGPSKSAETLLKYISPEQLPVQFGGLSVDYCDCNPEFTIDDPVIELIVKPATKQTVEIIIYEKCIIVWELRVVGWEVSYGAEFVPNDKEAYTVIIQKALKIAPTDNPVMYNSFKVNELGKVLLYIDNPTSKKKKLLYRFKVTPFSD